MSGMSYVEERTLYEIYLPAFEAAVKQGKVWGLLTHILREQWEYDGCVVTDWGAVKDRVKGLLAGQNLEMPGGSGAQDQKLVHAVENGTISKEELDRSVKEVLRLVYRTAASEKGQEREYATEPSETLEKIHTEAVRFAEEGAVLLKNEANLLPLKKEGTVAFIGEFAVSPRYQGNGSSHVNAYRVDSACEAAKEYGRNVAYARGYDKRTDHEEKQLFEEAVNLAKQVETAVLFVGLPDFYETEGEDRQHMRMPENQVRLIEEVSRVQPNTVIMIKKSRRFVFRLDMVFLIHSLHIAI